MRNILALLEDLVQAEFGGRDLAAVRVIAAERLEAPGRLPGIAGRAMAFVEAVAEVRRRELPEVYQFVAMKLVPVLLQDHRGLLAGHSTARSVLLQISQFAPEVLETIVPGLGPIDIDVELLNLETMRVRFEGPEVMLSVLEGVAMGLAAEFSERAEMERVAPPATAPQRRLLDIRIGVDRRTARSGPAPERDQRRRFTL